MTFTRVIIYFSIFFYFSANIYSQSTQEYVINENVKWLKNAIEKHSTNIYSPSFSCSLFKNGVLDDADPTQLFYYNINTKNITITQKISAKDVEILDYRDLEKSYIFYPKNGKYYLNPGIMMKINKYESVYGFGLDYIDTSGIRITDYGMIEIPLISNISAVNRKILADCRVYVQKKDTISAQEYDFMTYKLSSEIYELTDSVIELCNQSIKFSETTEVNKVYIFVDNSDNNRKLLVRALKNLYKVVMKKS